MILLRFPPISAKLGTVKGEFARPFSPKHFKFTLHVLTEKTATGKTTTLFLPAFSLKMATTLITYDNKTQPEIVLIRNGKAGNYDIVLRMLELVRSTNLLDKGFERGIKQLLVSKHFNAHTPIEQIFTLLFDFIKTNVVYILDIAGNIENIKSARETLADGFGDCDDLSILTASMLTVLGFENVKFCLANYSATDTTFTHVYTVCYTKGKRFVFDFAIPNGKLNQEVKSNATQEFGIFDKVSELDGLKSFFYQGGQVLQTLKNDTLKTIPEVLPFLPLGFGVIATTAISAGLRLINQETKTEKSFNATASDIIKKLDDIILQLRQSQIAFDNAKAQAKAVVMRLSYAKIDNPQNARTIANCIKKRIDYINAFDKTATLEKINIIYLNGKLIIFFGAAIIGATAYYLYNKRKEI